MLNPQGVQERTLEEMRPETLRDEELRRLRKREEELEKERALLLQEKEELQRQLQQKDDEKSRKRHEERRQNGIDEEDVQYRTPEEENPTAKTLFTEEADRPPQAAEATKTAKQQAGLRLMAMMMNTMTEMQKKILSKDGGKEGEGGVEYVRSLPEVPKLPDWNPSTGPIDLNDWLDLIEPITADSTATSGEWWDRLLQEARQWYQDHMAFSPLDRLLHEPKPTSELDQPRWVRLERRASTLLMVSIPEAQKEELVSTKRITAVKILCHLFTTFQPGGLAEKEVILRSLETPVEASAVAEAVSALRKWMRWRRRAMELQVSEPDPFLLLKGLGRIIRRPLEANREPNFRISLARSMLQVDSTPTKDTVGKFATHLLAEMEQIAHLEGSKRSSSSSKEAPKAAQQEVKIKKMEEGKGEGKSGKGERAPCKFFTTPEGCRKGKGCTWAHTLDDQKRCWNCGSTQHYAPACDRPKDPKKEGSPERQSRKPWEGKGPKPAATVVKKEEATKSEETAKEGVTEADSHEGTAGEANKMLKALQQGKSDEA